MRLKVLRATLAAAFVAASCAAQAASPPAQPSEGPGGVGDRKVTIVKRALGRPSAPTYAFYAAGSAPEAGRPVAVFLHGWGAVNPQSYGAWIDHLARQGWLVLFPRFQEVNRTKPSDAPAVAEALVKAALRYDPSSRRLYLADLKPVSLSFANRSLEEYVSRAARNGIPKLIAGILASTPIYQMESSFNARGVKEISVTKESVTVDFN